MNILFSNTWISCLFIRNLITLFFLENKSVLSQVLSAYSQVKENKITLLMNARYLHLARKLKLQKLFEWRRGGREVLVLCVPQFRVMPNAWWQWTPCAGHILCPEPWQPHCAPCLGPFRQCPLLCHAFCTHCWLSRFWLFVQTHVSCIWISRKRFHWIIILLLLNILWLANWLSELLPVMEIVFTRHLLRWVKRLSY